MKASSGSTSSSAVGAVGALSAGAGASSDVGAGLRCCLESSSSPPKTAAGSAFFAVGFLPPNENAFMLPATPDRFQRDARGRGGQLTRKMQDKRIFKNRRESGGQGLRPDERGSARVRGKASRAKQPACSQLRGLVAFVSRPALAALARRHGPHTPERRRYASRRECEQSRHALHTYPACATDPLPPWQIPPPDVERLPVFPGIHRPRRLSLRAQSVKRAHSRADAN